MFNEPTKEQLLAIPKLHETEGIPLKEKKIYLHFCLGRSDWFIANFDGKETFFGFAILNGWLEFAEWGYIPWDFLRTTVIDDVFEIENDVNWQVKKAVDVELICKAQGWEEESCQIN